MCAAHSRSPRQTQPGTQVEGLRERKKRATRQRLSDIATRLFMARGFDRVTVDDVATAAGVAKMTVFNYFARKEDLFFDRVEDVRALLRSALDGRGRRSPVEALRALAHGLVEQGHPAARVSRSVADQWKVVAGSATLQARALELLEELERDLGHMLTASVDAPASDSTARLIAAMVLGTWRVAYGEALRREASEGETGARRVFLDLLDRGCAAASAAARGTRYG